MIDLDPCFYGTHSLRRTKATLIYKKTGNLRAVQLLLGHTKIESTVRYLRIEVDDALAVAEQIDVWKLRQSRHALPPSPRRLCARSRPSGHSSDWCMDYSGSDGPWLDLFSHAREIRICALSSSRSPQRLPVLKPE